MQERQYNTEYQKVLYPQLQKIEEGIKGLKQEYTLRTLEELRKELHHLASNLKLYEVSTASSITEDIEYDVVAKIKNFYYVQPSEEWFASLDEFVLNLQEVIALVDAGMNDKKKKIVIVDDDEDILKLLDHEFVGLGFTVQTFMTGEPALTFLLDEKNLDDVFLVILDRVLPDMDGIDILHQFTAKSKVKIPVLILSLLGSEKDVLEGLQGGAVDYIAKPFSVYLLIQKAINLLKTGR